MDIIEVQSKKLEVSMLVNVYDFDGTIYKGDSGVDFVFYSLKKYPLKVLGSVIKTIPVFILMLLKKRKLTDVKSVVISYVVNVDIVKLLNDFWDSHENKICKWYLKQKKSNDVIISANYEFLLSEICKRLEIKNLIATPYDFESKKLVGIHSKGLGKITLFYEKYPNYKMNKTYSDAKVDIPLLEEGKEAYVVKGEKLEKYYKGYFK